MPTLRNAADRAAIVARLERLSPDARPAWGRMSAPQMVAHITDAFRMAFGELSVPRKNLWLARHFPVKHLILYVVPFPKNAPSAREIISRPPDSFDAERAQARALIERMDPAVPGNVYAAHPIFGQLTAEEWGVLGHKHLDHHLRQFGV